MASQLTVLEEGTSATEWRIGYVDGVPAVGDSEGRWYRVPEHTVVPHASSQLVWIIQHDDWSCIHQRHWDPKQVPATPADSWLKEEPIFTEDR